MPSEITHVEPQAMAVAEPSITSIIASAVASGRPASELTELLAFARQLDMDRARKEFASAMAEFKRTCPKIKRRTENSQFKVTRNGVAVNRCYASLSDIGEAIDGPLSAAGLSYDWTDAETLGETLRIGCIVRHSGGYVADAKYVTFPSASAAGASAQQKHASVIEYGRRYSLKNALGLTYTDDDDTDGAGEYNGDKITEEQAHSLNDALIEVQAKIPAFLGMFKIEKLSDLPASKFADAWKKIQDKKAGMKT